LQLLFASNVVMPFVLVFVAAFTCVLVCTRLATTLQFACAELEICPEQLTRAKPTKVHLEPADISELKIRMDRLERLMARVLNAVDKPLTSAAATQTHPQVKTEGYRHRQKSAQDLSQENPPATSVRARSWGCYVLQARKTQHNTSQRPSSQARSFESINGSFSLDSKAWNLQTSPNETDSSPKKFTVDHALRMLGCHSNAASGTLA